MVSENVKQTYKSYKHQIVKKFCFNFCSRFSGKVLSYNQKMQNVEGKDKKIKTSTYKSQWWLLSIRQEQPKNKIEYKIKIIY